MADNGRRIVVGIDGSPRSREALRWAVDQARRTGAQVRAVAAWDVSPFVYLAPTATEETYEQAAETVLNEVVESVLDGEDDVPIERVMVQGRPGPAVAKAARGAELLVIGSHGHGEIPGMHLGSTAGYCVHHAPCPVLVIRHDDA